MRITLLPPITLLWTLLSLSACSTLSQDTLSNRTHWQFSGSVASVYQDDKCLREVCPKKSEQGKITWRQQGEYYQISVSDPFQRVLWSLQGTGQQAQLQTPDGNSTLDQVDAFLSQRLGLPLTLQTLQQWVLGQVDENLPYQRINAQTFVQLGLRVQFAKTSETALPTRVIVTDSRNGNKIKLAIVEWKTAGE